MAGVCQVGAVPGFLGVDGCRTGWIGAHVDLRAQRVEWLALADAREIVDVPAEAIGIDIPIGLPADGPRAADICARARIVPRGSCVFPAPVRAVLGAMTYEEACRRSLVASGRSMTLQTFHILPKITDVDRIAAMDVRVAEVHPEVSFSALAGRVLLTRKRTPAGRAERLALLGRWLPWLNHVDVPPGDDAVDALAAAWSTWRWSVGTADALPGRPWPVDAAGRPMRIVV